MHKLGITQERAIRVGKVVRWVDPRWDELTNSETTEGPQC
jgi:hypothetical protein